MLKLFLPKCPVAHVGGTAHHARTDGGRRTSAMNWVKLLDLVCRAQTSRTCRAVRYLSTWTCTCVPLPVSLVDVRPWVPLGVVSHRRRQLESVNRTAHRQEAEELQELSATRSWNGHLWDQDHAPENDMERLDPHRLSRVGHDDERRANTTLLLSSRGCVAVFAFGQHHARGEDHARAHAPGFPVR